MEKLLHPSPHLYLRLIQIFNMESGKCYATQHSFSFSICSITQSWKLVNQWSTVDEMNRLWWNNPIYNKNIKEFIAIFRLIHGIRWVYFFIIWLVYYLRANHIGYLLLMYNKKMWRRFFWWCIIMNDSIILNCMKYICLQL